MKRKLRKIAIWLFSALTLSFAIFVGIAYLPITTEARKQAFFAVAQQGDTKSMKRFLDSGLSANMWLRPESPRYMWVVRRIENDPEYLGMKYPVVVGAAESKNIDAVKLLLDNGADIDACGPSGMTALLVAADDDLPMVRLLLAHGADPYCCWKDGSIPQSKDPAIEVVLLKAQRDWKGPHHGHRGNKRPRGA